MKKQKLSPYSWIDFNGYYDLLVSKAQYSFCCKKYLNSIRCIESAGFLQYNLNRFYRDERLEKLLINIGKSRYNLVDRIGVKKRYIFYDSFGWDNRGLTQQYIDALNYLPNCEYIFVFEKKDVVRSKHIVQSLTNAHVTIVELSGGMYSKMDTFYDLLNSYNPSGVFLHLEPWGTLPLIVLSAFPQITKYMINLTDHAFWLGSSLLDYSLEFRGYGCTVSLQKRNLRKEQLLLLPYYPIDSGFEEFKGFPVSTEGKVVMFSGGSFYKIYSSDNFYFNLVADLLNNNPKLLFLYAGGGDDSIFRSFIKRRGLADRVCLLGFRDDINEIFEHIDIYLGTYPYSGGLMSQYAALHGKPLLVFSSNSNISENEVCTKKCATFSFNNREELLKEAHKLISDDLYRKERGSFFSSLIAGRDDFRRRFRELLDDNKDKCDYALSTIDYESFAEGYLKAINEGYKGFSIEINILKAIGFSTLYQTPKVLFNLLPYLCKKALETVKFNVV